VAKPAAGPLPVNASLLEIEHDPLQVADDLSPLRVLALFSAITAEDCILLDVADRPEYLIMTHIPVPPVCIRPSVDMDSGQGSNEDDLTVRLRVCLHMDALHCCQVIHDLVVKKVAQCN